MPSAPKWVFDVFEHLLSPKLPIMEVVDSTFLSSAVKKIRFKGILDDLNFDVGSYIDFRVDETEVRRYTPSYVDKSDGIVEFIVHLHGAGPGRNFMDNLNVGDKIPMNQPRSYRYYNESAFTYVIVGDETSLAIASSFFSMLKRKGNKLVFYFELDEENKNVPKLLGLEDFTVFPKDGSFRNEDWLNALPVMRPNEWQQARFVLTGNAKSVQAFRKVLKSNKKSNIVSHGYWLEGKRGL